MSQKARSTKTKKKRQIFNPLEAKSLRVRSFPTRLADFLTKLTGTPAFLFLNIVFFIVWIALNGEWLTDQVIDPFPFSLLTLIVSLEAILLSIFVLISQNRSAHTATLREELHLSINEIAEQEITKILQILVKIEEKLDIKDSDPDLKKMLDSLDPKKIERNITRQLKAADTLIKLRQ